MRMSDPSRSADLVDFDMLASSLSKRGVRVEDAGPGAAPWTDGTAIFVDLAAPRRTQLRQLCVQCALLAAGSFEAGLLKAMKRRPTLAARYLVVEAHRALLALDAVLPPLARSLIDPGLAGRTASPTDSLSLARTSEPLPEPPTDFGTINVRALLSASGIATGEAAGGTRHLPRNAQQQALPRAGGAVNR